MFDRELAYFIKHQDDLVKQNRGKVLVLRGDEVVGAYESAIEAYLAAGKQFPKGTFMLQPCEPGPNAYTASFD